MEISGSSAIVTGAASGLGRATATELAKRGVHVVVADRKEDAGREVAAALGGTFVNADVTDVDQVGQAVAAAVKAGPLRVVVNCAGLSVPGLVVDRNHEPADFKKFEFVIRVNLLGTFNVTRLAAAAVSKTKLLSSDERGVIVNTASVAAFDGQIGQSAYSAAKGGVVAMTLPMARDLARHGIRVNTIAPGLFDTPIWGTGERADVFKARVASASMFPSRLGYAEEYASLALELISNSFMNGEVVRIDGAVRLPPR
jgi:NAD(P)-dependent dehydrogenase (short-subunit alcohol dehydrogenase family)